MKYDQTLQPVPTAADSKHDASLTLISKSSLLLGALKLYSNSAYSGMMFGLVPPCFIIPETYLKSMLYTFEIYRFHNGYLVIYSSYISL